MPNQLTAAALVIQYWVPAERINPGVWITIFLAAIITVNYFGVKIFGEVEFWLSSVKVIVVIGLIILSLVLAVGGGPDHDVKGFRYWKNPGAFASYLPPGGMFFAYLGTELVGVTVGEAQNPRKVIPRAIKLTFYRILVFYVLSVLFIGMNIPYNSPELAFAVGHSVGASASPFVVAIKLAGITTLPSVVNGAILLFVFSAANSDLYIATRTIYGLAADGKAPRAFSRTNAAGVPVVALAVSALFGGLAYLSCADDSRVVFGYFVNLVSTFGLLTWISILIAHVCFVRVRVAQGVPTTSMPCMAPLGSKGSIVAAGFSVVIAVTKNFDVFLCDGAAAQGHGTCFNYRHFVTGYLGLPIYVMLVVGYKIAKKTKRARPLEADLFTGKDKIDREEEDFVAEETRVRRAQGRAGGTFFYRKFLSWLF
ncbi:hypothetical protein MRB53_040256 [Persea americana]|nr:hypothetical protein MRB53_040256 [Persea americana]